MKTYKDYSCHLIEPLAILSLVHCGQVRNIDEKHKINTLTRIYRIEPHSASLIEITYDFYDQQWQVKNTLGKDPKGESVISSEYLQMAIGECATWTKMETALATYFDCDILEYHNKSPGKRRLKTRPRINNGD